MVIDNLDKLMAELKHVQIEKFPDNQLNQLYNYYYFLEEQEALLETTRNISLDQILYSKYYWFSRLTERFHEVYGVDAGIDQQQFMIMEELDQRIENVDWTMVERITYVSYK